MCHRDPLAMLSSVTSLTATLRWARANTVDYRELAREQAALFAAQCDRLLAWRTSGTVDDSRVLDVRFDEFMADQARHVTSVYEHFGLPVPADGDERLAAHLSAKPQGRHGGHAHEFEAMGLDQDELRARFAAYQDHFGVRSEEP